MCEREREGGVEKTCGRKSKWWWRWCELGCDNCNLKLEYNKETVFKLKEEREREQRAC